MGKRSALVLAAALIALAAMFFWKPDQSEVAEKVGDAPDAPTKVQRPVVNEARPAAPPSAVTRDDDPKGTLRLEGQVLDAAGAPVGGALVIVDAKPVRTVTTEDDGSFGVDGLVGRRYSVRARHGKRASEAVRHALTEASAPVILRISEAASLVVSVVTEEGTALADATVTVDDSDTASTNEEGVARFDGVRGFVQIQAAKEGYAMHTRWVEVPTAAGAEAEVDISLRRGVAVTGRVVDDRGKPVAGVSVEAVSVSSFSAMDTGKPAETDQQGRFEIPAVAPGAYRLSARHKLYAPSVSALEQVGTEPVTGVEIELQEGGTIAGRVVDRNGAPVPWAEVRARRQAQNLFEDARKALCDEDGAFEMTGLPRREMRVVANGKTAASEFLVLDLRSKAKHEGVELTVSVEGAIAGKVVDQEGQPLADVQVRARPDFMGGDMSELVGRGIREATTDAAGEFVLQPLAEGDYRVVASRGRSGGWWRTDGTKARPGDQGVVVVLAAGGLVRGQVQFVGGGAPERFNVFVNERLAGTGDKHGKFSLPEIVPGTHDIVIRGPGFASKTVPDVKVTSGGTKDLGTVQVVRGRTLSGRVVDTAGKPVAGATVSVGQTLFGDGKTPANALGSQQLRTGESAADGRFEVGGLSTIELAVVADHDTAGRSQTAKVVAGTQDLAYDLVVQPHAALRGTVTKGGAPAPGGMVMLALKGLGSQAFMAPVGEDGAFVFERLAAGTYTATAMDSSAMAGGGAMINEEVTLSPGGEQRIELSLGNGENWLTVTIKGEGGAEISGAQMYMADGVINVKTAKELKELGGSGSANMSFAMGSKPTRLGPLEPGKKSLCIIPFGGDMGDAQFVRRLRKYSDQLEVHCSRVTVADAPKEQAVTVTVPPMKPFPDETETDEP